MCVTDSSSLQLQVQLHQPPLPHVYLQAIQYIQTRRQRNEASLRERAANSAGSCSPASWPVRTRALQRRACASLHVQAGNDDAGNALAVVAMGAAAMRTSTPEKELWSAAASGDDSEVGRLLDAGAFVDWPNQDDVSKACAGEWRRGRAWTCPTPDCPFSEGNCHGHC